MAMSEKKINLMKINKKENNLENYSRGIFVVQKS